METALRIHTIRLLVKLEKNPTYVNSLDISYSTNKYSYDVDSSDSVSENLKKEAT